MKCTPKGLVYLPSIVKSFIIAFTTSSQGYQMEEIRYVDFLISRRGTTFPQNICTSNIEFLMHLLSLMYLHLELAIPVIALINLGLIKKCHLYTTTLPPSHEFATYPNQLGLQPFMTSIKQFIPLLQRIIQTSFSLLISFPQEVR